jgi:hypothetical protein
MLNMAMNDPISARVCASYYASNNDLLCRRANVMLIKSMVGKTE